MVDGVYINILTCSFRNAFFSEFSHQTKTVYVGGLEDGIDDPELHTYFSEFGFVTRALRSGPSSEKKKVLPT